jgi:hypothetical protein
MTRFNQNQAGSCEDYILGLYFPDMRFECQLVYRLTHLLPESYHGRHSNWLRGLTPKRSEFESRWGQEFSPFHIAQTGSGTHPTSNGYRERFPRG